MSKSDANLMFSEFDQITEVIQNPEKFKLKLGIGSDAYTSLKAAKITGALWDTGGAASTGAAVASAPPIAGALFGTFWTKVGLVSLVPPAWWIAGVAIVSGGAFYGVTRLYRSYTTTRVEEVPKFLNTGIDLLATTLFDLIATLYMKVAAIDGDIDQREVLLIKQHFVQEWGYDERYVDSALMLISDGIAKSTLAEITKQIAEFLNTNPDCNFDNVKGHIESMLKDIAAADGVLDEREEMALQRVAEVLKGEASWLSAASRSLSGVSDKVSGVFKKSNNK